MKNIFFISLIFLILASCGKNKEVKIIAKNAATGAPYAGLEYLVVSSRTAANGEKYKTEARERKVIKWNIPENHVKFQFYNSFF